MSSKTSNGEARLEMVPLNKIRESQVALRKVERDSEKYLGLVDSIKERGVLNPILIREIKDPETGEKLYGLIDGLHRFSAACDAGLKVIPAQVRNMEQAELEEAQIVANVHKVETRPVEYTKQLVRLMLRNPLLTVSELSKRLSKTPEWLYDRFGLLALTEDIQKLVDEGQIKLNNAYQLRKLPADEQINFVDRAMTMQPNEFNATIASRKKELTDAKRQGRAPKTSEWQPVAHHRSWAELKSEYSEPKVGPELVQRLKIKDPTEAFKLAVAWMSNMDPDGQNQQRERHEEQVRLKEEQKIKQQAERAQQRAREAAEKAAQVGA